MICQCCGVEAPTQKVLFVRHIGAVIMFFHKRISGRMCRNCVNTHFIEYGGMTLLLGWWGVISVFATPVVLLLDIVNYLRAWNLAPVPQGATAPQLTDAALGRLQPLTGELVSRLNANEPFDRLASEIGDRAAVTPGQVALFVQYLIKQSKRD